MKRKLIRRPKKVMLTKAIKPVSPKVKRIRIKRKPVTPLENLKRVMHRHLYLKDDSYIDVTVGAIFANQLDKKPVWIYLVGGPGTGKTDLVQAMDGHPLIKSLSTITPKTLVSGYKEDQSKSRVKKPEEDPSLLPKLDGKNLIIKDFTPLLEGRAEDRTAIFGQFRDAYDGTMAVAYGTGKDVTYKSKFGVIAAVTPVIDHYVKGEASVGKRFLMTRMPELTKAEYYLMMDKMSEGHSDSKKEEEIKAAMHAVLNQKVQIPYISKEYHRYIADTAYLVAKSRADVHRDKRSRSIDIVPIEESPTRVFGQICAWAMGISMARQSQYMTMDALAPACNAALGSINPTRLSVLQKLSEIYPEGISLRNLLPHVRLEKTALQYILDDLCCLGVIELKQQGGPKVAAKWACADDIHEILLHIEAMNKETDYV